MAHTTTYSGTVYGPAYSGRFVRAANIRNPLLRRRGTFKQRYAVKDVEGLLNLIATDVERREQYEESLVADVQRMRQENEHLKYALRSWQGEQARAAWEAGHPV